MSAGLKAPRSVRKWALNSVKRLFKWAAALLAVGVLAWQIGVHRSAFLAVPWLSRPLELLLLSVAHVLLFFFFCAGWWCVLASMGRRTSFLQAAASWLIPNIGKYIPGKVLMGALRVELIRSFGMKRMEGACAFGLETALILLAALPFALWSFLCGSMLRFSVASISLGLGIMGMAAVAIALPFTWLIPVNAVLVRLRKAPLPTRLDRRFLALALLCCLAAWCCFGYSGVILTELAAGVLPDPWVVVAGAFVLAWLLGFLSFLTPGGIGVREGVLVFLLKPYIASDLALVVAVVSRLVWTVFEMGGVLLGLWIRDGGRRSGSRNERGRAG